MKKPQEVLDRTLASASSSHNLKLAREALQQGANPNVFSGHLYQFPLTVAVKRWADLAERKKEAAAQKGEAFIDMLLDAGADPLAFERGESPLFSEDVCAHPRCKEIILERLSSRAKVMAHIEEVDQPATHYNTDRSGVLHYLRQLAKDTPFYRTVRDRLLDAGLPSRIWWQAALASSNPALMAYVLEKRGQAKKLDWSVPQVLKHLNKHPVSTPQGLMAWLEHLSPQDQVDALLGVEGTNGVLALSARGQKYLAYPLWDFAMKQTHLIKAIEDRGLLREALALSMLAKPQHAQTLLRKARRKGIDVPQVRVGHAQALLGEILEKQSSLCPFWDSGPMPTASSSLLSMHLGRTGADPSITVMRALIRAGVKPDFEALCVLCAKMTYSAKDKKLIPIFEEWTQEHGIDPCPEGQMAAWDYVTLSRPNNVARSRVRSALETGYRKWQMENALPCADPLPSPTRARISRL